MMWSKSDLAEWLVPSNFIWLATRVQILEKKKKFIVYNEANNVEIKTNEDNHPMHVWGQQKVTFLNIYFYEMKNWSVKFIVYYLFIYFSHWLEFKKS